jgi:hypothetical protein
MVAADGPSTKPKTFADGQSIKPTTVVTGAQSTKPKTFADRARAYTSKIMRSFRSKPALKPKTAGPGKMATVREDESAAEQPVPLVTGNTKGFGPQQSLLPAGNTRGFGPSQAVLRESLLRSGKKTGASRITFVQPPAGAQASVQNPYAILAAQRATQAQREAEDEAYYEALVESGARAQDAKATSKSRGRSKEAKTNGIATRGRSKVEEEAPAPVQVRFQEPKATRGRSKVESPARVQEPVATRGRSKVQEGRTSRGRSKRDTAAQQPRADNPFAFRTINTNTENSCGRPVFQCIHEMEGSYGCFFKYDNSTWKNILSCDHGDFDVLVPQKDGWKEIDTKGWQAWARKQRLGVKVFKTLDSKPRPFNDEISVSAPIVNVLGSAYTTFQSFDGHLGFALRFSKQGVAIRSSKKRSQYIDNNIIYVVPSISCEQDMHDYIAKSMDEYWEIANNLARALSLLHSSGYVHQDIKPANMVMCPTAWGSPLKLIDFGMAKHLSAINPRFNGGTENFVSPIRSLWVDDKPPSTDGNKLAETFDLSHENTQIIRDMVSHHIQSFYMHFEAITGIKSTYANIDKAYHDRQWYDYFVNLIYPKADMFAAALSMIIIALNSRIRLRDIIGPLYRWVEFPSVGRR